MLFSSKPLLYLQLLDHSLRYLALDPKNHSVVDKDEIVFDATITEDGKITNAGLLETRLDALVKEKKWKNAKTHLLLLNDFVTVREEMIPGQLTPSEVKEYLSLHINQSIRLPFEHPVFDFEITEQSDDKQKVVILAYPGEYIEQYKAILQKASLKPAVADIPALCFYRLADQQNLIDKEPDNHTLLLEWNPIDLSIMVFNQDSPRFNRHSRSARLADSWTVSQNGEWLWKDSEPELADMLDDQLNGLERFLDFYRYSVLDGEGTVTDIVLTGYYPELTELKTRLEERFDAKIHLLDLPGTIGQRFSALHGLSIKEGSNKRKKQDKSAKGKQKSLRGKKASPGKEGIVHD
ncbi:type IV pilus assembly protein PilM [Alkalibacterium subtropicum]|uniref:Type IV pilus assembly protein PilM n=1 Tax=Alkalibacterium subtropicum TaxID=753702 RepID=A0A1I1IZ64_9LACT|nr:pilus assembly protein PilM [Alkalibacterium subtropicum]SFC41455.1 type IV pilus assembly protein PilM [Alkalibacterium subtropicum]